MVNLIYTGKDRLKINEDISKISKDLSKLFSIKIPDITIRVHENRALFNKQLKKETPDWLVANASNNKEIDILSPHSLKNESSHKPTEFLQIIKHELTHLFVYELSNGCAVPKWLNEGLASYVAKQHQNDKKVIY